MATAAFQRLTRRFVTFGSSRVAYSVVGSGPTLLLVHGLGGSADFWQPLIGRLHERFTLVVPDLLGFGFSAKARGPYTLARHTGALAALLHGEKISQLHGIVAHSVGCVVAVALQASGLAQAGRLALAAAAFPSPRFRLRDELVTQRWFRLLLDNRHLARVDLAVWHALWPLIRRRQVPEYLQGGFAGLVDYTADSFYETAEELLFRADLEPLLARLHECPTLLLHSKADQTVPFVHAERLHAALPHSTLIGVAGGHYAVINEGLDLLVDWLSVPD